MLSKLIISVFLVSASAFSMNASKGDWVGSGGVGLSLSPTLMMISPQLEYVYSPDVTFGVLSQMAFGADGDLFTFTGTGRLIFARRGKLFPVLEGGLGMAIASGLFPDSLGVHIMAGFGVDYAFDQTTSIGTMLRFNFAPPLKSMFITWPLLIGRFLL